MTPPENNSHSLGDLHAYTCTLGERTRSLEIASEVLRVEVHHIRRTVDAIDERTSGAVMWRGALLALQILVAVVVLWAALVPHRLAPAAIQQPPATAAASSR